MDKYITQGAGFPADNEFLMLIQSMIVEAAKLSAIGGKDYILSGCEVTGQTVSAGFMVLNNEIVRFGGGQLGTQVSIQETVTNATYLEDVAPVDGLGDSKPTYFAREAVFSASGVYSIAWANLKRVKPLIEAQYALVPVNGVIMYSGAIGDIPEGWQLCNGANGTPDLKGMFIVGYDPDDFDYDTIGKQGGSKSVTLNISQMPAHKHSGTTNNAGAHTHTYTIREDNYGSGDGPSLTNNTAGNDEGNRTFNTASNGNHAHSLNMNNEGGGASHPNRPPYYTMAYIIYKGI